MLASSGKPFDSPDHLFEIKWDGMRLMTYVEGDVVRALNRSGVDVVPGFPELEILGSLPDGTVLDGELIALEGGRPDLGRLMSRHLAGSAERSAALMRKTPAVLVVFDLLYSNFESVMSRPLTERRELLEGMFEGLELEPTVVISTAVREAGVGFYEEAISRRLEGIVAKRLDSRYEPGKRSDSWIKIKPRPAIACLILGFVCAAPGDLRSLVIAEERDGVLTHAGRVGSGLDERTRRDLLSRLPALERDSPLVPAPEDSQVAWVEPRLYCAVSFHERTKSGELRAPVFCGLIDSED